MRTLVLAAAAAGAAAQQPSSFTITDVGTLDREFDGIGGLSGGGATSVLLPSYPDQQKSEILDYLFKPNFGANLHILKVEIGGDAQSTDGAESSHMHVPWEEDYTRGYEWMLLTEAKKRNPDIKLYGLAWAWPQWVTCQPGVRPLTNCSNNPWSWPQQTADYVVKWVNGAKAIHGVDIDYVGSWNERNYDATYLITLRASLDAAGFTKTKIVAPDSGWGIAGDILNNPALANAVWGLGAHYPGMHSDSQAIQTGKPLWASEDDSTYNSNSGNACWARLINRNYVLGNMTATIMWNLLAAYMKGTNWYRAGMFTAMQPWSGHYGDMGGVWASAHTNQFAKNDGNWRYLTQTGAVTGSGELAAGGTYVTLKNTATGDFTIVIEKMSAEYSSCVRPGLPGYTTAAEVATFTLGGGLAGVTQLRLWRTHFAFASGDNTTFFEALPPVPVVGGKFTLQLDVDSLYTLTTLTTGGKGDHGVPPPAATFPRAWTDNFEACAESSEGAYWTDQNGIFECHASGDAAHGIVMRQMVPLRPVTWGGDIRPHSLIGSRDSVNQSLVIDAFLNDTASGVLLGVHMQGTDNSGGLIWSVDAAGNWNVTTSIQNVDKRGSSIFSGTLPTPPGAGAWHTYRLDVNVTAPGVQTLAAWFDGAPVLPPTAPPAGAALSGHFAVGSPEYANVMSFDNAQLYSTQVVCGGTPLVAGAPVSIIPCKCETGPTPGGAWDFITQPGDAFTGVFQLHANPSLCLTENATGWLELQPCGGAGQTWKWTFGGIAPDGERPSQIANVGTGHCIDIYSQLGEIGYQMDAYSCNKAGNQAFWFDATDPDYGEIGNEAYSVCVGVC